MKDFNNTDDKRNIKNNLVLKSQVSSFTFQEPGRVQDQAGMAGCNVMDKLLSMSEIEDADKGVGKSRWHP